jgi:hypothetical protein
LNCRPSFKCSKDLARAEWFSDHIWERLGQESLDPIGHDLAATHNAPALMFGLFVRGGFAGGDLPHHPHDVGSLDRADAELAHEWNDMVMEISAILRDT